MYRQMMLPAWNRAYSWQPTPDQADRNRQPRSYQNDPHVGTWWGRIEQTAQRNARNRTLPTGPNPRESHRA
jgi:hypothetical protein